MAFIQYAQDFDGNWPSGASGTGNGWAGSVYPYAKSDGAFQCPDDPTGPQLRTVDDVNYVLKPVSYAMNWALSYPLCRFWGHGSSVSHMTDPTRTVLLYEITGSFHAGLSASDFNVADLSTPNEAGGAPNGYDSCYSAKGTGFFADNSYSNLRQATGFVRNSQRHFDYGPVTFTGRYGRHQGGANYLACDGHVKWLRAESVSIGAFVPQIKPTTAQDHLSVFQAAGTHSPENWTMTYSPI